MTKEDKAKLIPINQHVCEVLAKLPRAINHDFVFTYHGKPITSLDGCRNALVTACKAAGVAFGRKLEGGITFHDIRRTVKTNMLRAGVDKVHRDLILGHSLQGMDAHYLAPSENDLQEAMGKYTAWFDAQIGFVSESVSNLQEKAN